MQLQKLWVIVLLLKHVAAIQMTGGGQRKGEQTINPVKTKTLSFIVSQRGSRPLQHLPEVQGHSSQISYGTEIRACEKSRVMFSLVC